MGDQMREDAIREEARRMLAAMHKIETHEFAMMDVTWDTQSRDILDDLRAVRADLALSRDGTGEREALANGKTTAERALDAILAFLDLHPVERGFVRHLAENRLDDATLAVFADYLEEHGQSEVGNRVRLLRPQSRDILVAYSHSDDPENLRHIRENARPLVEAGLVARVAVLPPGADLSVFSPEELREAGLVSIEEADQRVREAVAAERARCLAVARQMIMRAEEVCQGGRNPLDLRRDQWLAVAAMVEEIIEEIEDPEVPRVPACYAVRYEFAGGTGRIICATREDAERQQREFINHYHGLAQVWIEEVYNG